MTDLEEKQMVVELVKKLVKQNEYDRFLSLIDSLDKLNQEWFLHFMRRFINENENENENEWVIWNTEPQEYLNLFNELFEILDGYYWYYEMPEFNLPDDIRVKWTIHKIK